MSKQGPREDEIRKKIREGRVGSRMFGLRADELGLKV